MNMIRIGSFARIAQVSTRTLRLYDKLGLLKPDTTVLHEDIVVGRNEEVVPGSDSTESELNAIVKELLEVSYVD